MFMVTDDLVVSPLSSTTCFNYLNRLKVPPSEVEELVVDIRIQEALNLLCVALNSNSVLTNGLKDSVEMKHLRDIPKDRSLQRNLLHGSTEQVFNKIDSQCYCKAVVYLDIQVHLYENLLNGCETVESQLLLCITKHLTAEIVQLKVSDITRAIEWMKCSYLYVRMKKCPENYAIQKGMPTNRIEKHLQEICVQKVNELSQYQMIWTDEDGFLLKPLGIQLRRNEKKILDDINTDKEG
ncbi:hypothetical protein POM88_000325 [Heracleum sosnowskyi]|uniref:DNA 3'-5' helicase n=1 Tax=Heracleum sosnowskyi TaxID=360622 RepID=A0AAD8JE25_9APIA|nr:hypothetical protein POM88_000325 [Heracleum sosnowskyi]